MKKIPQTPFDVNQIRRDFPILSKKINGKPLIYFDNAATTQKSEKVIDAVCQYYKSDNANIHRGVHTLSETATAIYEKTREKVKTFLNAKESDEIIYVRGTTEAINLVANSYGRQFLEEGDEIILSEMEHHSNIVPWQQLCDEKKLKLRVIPINDKGELLLDEFEKLICPRTKFISIVYISNSLGTINPIKQIIHKAHEHEIPVLVDGAQSTSHMMVDVQDLDCDFYTISGHKLYGPTGIGVLYGKKHLLEKMPPYQGGGDMIRSVSFKKTTYNVLPNKFEAGTPNIAGVAGLGAAVDYINTIGLDVIAHYEHDLFKYATNTLSNIDGLKIIGTAADKTAVISFLCGDIHPHDIGTILDHNGIAIRAGHHCTQPLMERLGLTATARVSLAFYNTKSEIDYFAESIPNLFRIFS